MATNTNQRHILREDEAKLLRLLREVRRKQRVQEAPDGADQLTAG